MAQTTQSAGVSDKDVQDLEQFAEKNFEADRISEVLAEVPSLVQRGTIYLICGAILLTLALLYFTNSLGACAGVLASGFLLVPWCGLPGTLLIAGMTNLALAAAVFHQATGLHVLLSTGTDEATGKWEHMSVSYAGGPPSYDQLMLAKRIFWGADAEAVMVFPAEDDSIDISHCWHIWRQNGPK